jgi:hypothetical protein
MIGSGRGLSGRDFGGLRGLEVIFEEGKPS